MTFSSAALGRLAPVTSLVVTLAIVDWAIRPERAWVWMLSLALMAAIGLVVAFQSAAERSSDAQRRHVVTAGVFAASLVLAGLVVGFLRGIGYQDSWICERAPGLVLGLTLLWMGNALPKQSVSSKVAACAEGSYAMRRSAGWMFVIAGVVYLCAWLFAPLAQADVIATVACASATALVMIRCLVRPTKRA